MIYIMARKGNNLLTDFFIADDSISLLSFGDIFPLLNHFYDDKAALYKNITNCYKRQFTQSRHSSPWGYSNRASDASFIVTL
ncbi:hypothetical protein EQP49_00815 [Yersinia sp. 2105 StPb PI]|nr:hypothetical protein CBW53_07780 [Yersinia frederiksenii]RXA98117.1 hypothetical protein EQP49_00815 [Yersinia sp. 2105 StPb PI]